MSRKKQSVALAAIPKPTVPIAQAAASLASVCDLIDGGANPKDAIVQVMFAAGRRQLADCVDEHIAFKTFVEGAAETAKQAKAAWEASRKRLVAVAAAVDELLKTTIEEKPDLPYSGRIGSLAVHKNPPKVVLAWGEDTSVTEEQIQFWGIDEEYLRRSAEVDLDAIKRDLKAGKDIPWATTVQGTKLAVTT